MVKTKIVEVKKIGEGTYGKVYKVNYENSKEESAIKRNFKDINTLGIGCLKELNMLANLKNHPLIVDLKKISYDNPFDNVAVTPIKKNKNYDEDIEEDGIYFIMEYLPYSGRQFFSNKELCNAEVGKVLTCQLLLAMEYLHALNITHRDIKPENILISYDKFKKPILKIADFGMSQILSDSYPSTPGVVTCWYRAPEICFEYTKYGQSSDMWSIGCVIFEIFGSSNFIKIKEDKNSSILNEIVKKYPNNIDIHFSKKYIDPKIIKKNLNIEKKSFVKQMNISKEIKKELLNSNINALDDLEDLISSLIEFDFDKRKKAEELLSHPFIKVLKKYIKNFREKYKPNPDVLPIIKIIKCKERYWMSNIAIDIYNNRKKIDWYKNKVLFHSIEIFDRYLVWAFDVETKNIKFTKEDNNHGYLLTKYQTVKIFYNCLYFVHKYHSTMNNPYKWENFIPEKIFEDSDYKNYISFEKIIINKVVTDYKIIGYSLLEVSVMYEKLSKNKISYLLEKYLKIEEWEDGSIRALYRHLMEIEE